ncbi:hypothetical protein GW17_00036152 [Ensete ventricosum]|nr:hypothetical protein GW17_00036152 [Ensete ventricosum]
MLSFTGSTTRSVACGSPTRFVACAARGEGSMLAPREEKDRYDADNRPLPGGSAKNRPLAIDFDRRRSIEQEKEKKRRKRSKKEKRKRIPIARAQSSPMHRRRSHAAAARGSQALFLPREEKDRGDKQKEEGKKEYLASAVLARLPSPPAGRLRTVAACARSPPVGRPRPLFLPREETDRGDLRCPQVLWRSKASVVLSHMKSSHEHRNFAIRSIRTSYRCCMDYCVFR